MIDEIEIGHLCENISSITNSNLLVCSTTILNTFDVFIHLKFKKNNSVPINLIWF